MDELSLEYRAALIGAILFLESEPIDEAGLAMLS